MNLFSDAKCFSGSFIENVYVGTGVGGAGHHLYHGVHAIGVGDTVRAVALFAVVHLWAHIDLVLRGAGLCPGAGVHHAPGIHWNHNLQERRAGQGPKAQMERRALYLTEVVLQTQINGEILVKSSPSMFCLLSQIRLTSHVFNL